MHMINYTLVLQQEQLQGLVFADKFIGAMWNIVELVSFICV